MNKRLIAFLSILAILLSIPLNPISAATKSLGVKEGASCSSFGELSKKLQCVTVDNKKIWQEIALTDGSKKYPNEGSECFSYQNLIVLGKLTSGKLGQIECVWNNEIIGSKAYWKLSNFVPNNAAVKTGSTCSHSGTKILSSGMLYKCTKSGKKLVWSKGISTTIPKVDDVQKEIDYIRTTALLLPYSNASTFKFVFQGPTSTEIEEKTKRSLNNAIPIFAKLGFPITDGLVLVAKDDVWLRDELIRNGCRTNFEFPQSTGFYVGRTCQSGNGAVTGRHWDVMQSRDSLDGLFFNHILPHEYFHQIQYQLNTFGSVGFPMWFYEGSAQFFTNQAWVSWNPQKSYVDWHTYWSTDLIPFGPKVCKNATILMMSDPLPSSLEGVCAYTKGQLIVEYLIFKYGLDKYRDLYRLNTSTDRRNFNVVFKNVTKDELDDFYILAERFMLSRGW
jgi:hypothetical protein